LKTCKFCGKEIDEKRTYCSRACRNKANPRRFTEEPHVEKVCVQCGKPFLSRRTNRLYCSNACNWKTRTERKPRRAFPDQTYWQKRRDTIRNGQQNLCWLCHKELPARFDVHHLQGDHDVRISPVAALHKKCHTKMHKITLCTDGILYWFEGEVIELIQKKGLKLKENET